MDKAESLENIAAGLATLAAEVAKISKGQANIVATLGMLIETLQTQSEQLHEIAAIASEEAGPSPLTKSLEDIAAGIGAVDASLGTIGSRLAHLPQAVADELASRRAQEQTAGC